MEEEPGTPSVVNITFELLSPACSFVLLLVRCFLASYGTSLGQSNVVSLVANDAEGPGTLSSIKGTPRMPVLALHGRMSRKDITVLRQGV